MTHDFQDTNTFSDSKRLDALLQEQGLEAEESAELLPSVQRLQSWRAPQPTSVATERLLLALRAQAPTPSPTRQFLQQRYASSESRFRALLHSAASQISILRPTFWILSALITLLGCFFLLSPTGLAAVFEARLIAPLLAYLGTYYAFRSKQARVVEFELACPPSFWQITAARLCIVLGYNILLGLLLNGLLWLNHGGNLFFLLLHWLVPLLLVTGLGLFLSLRLPISYAAAGAYGCWLALVLTSLLVGENSRYTLSLLTIQSELVLGAIGLSLLILTLVRIQRVPGSLLSQNPNSW